MLEKAPGERWIDVHAHHFPAGYLDALERAGVAAVRGPRAVAGTAERLELMDRAAVDVQLLSPARLLPSIASEADGRRVARIGNELLAEVVRDHPGRFGAFAVLPLPHTDAAMEELAYALDDLRMTGVTVGTSILGRTLADAAFEPVFAELDRRRALLYVHPVGNGAQSPLVADHGLTWRIGAPLEDTIAAAHLITSGLLDRHARMRVIMSHAGGALPMLLGRLDALACLEGGDDPGGPLPSAVARRLWFDTCVHGDHAALRCACQAYGPDRLLLGTDYPYQDGEQYVRAVRFLADAGLPDDQVRTVLRGTSVGVLAGDLQKAR